MYHHITSGWQHWYRRTKRWWVHLGANQKQIKKASKVLKGKLVQLIGLVPGRREEMEMGITFKRIVTPPSNKHEPTNILECYISDFYFLWGKQCLVKGYFLLLIRLGTESKHVNIFKMYLAKLSSRKMVLIFYPLALYKNVISSAPALYS